MEREASFLRCSKLSCYAEFNRMVQAIARNGGSGGDHNELQNANRGTGTSAEYQFYYTLATMLRETVNNTDPVSQKRDLQRVYSWYCLNKPIIRAKTKKNQTKPVLVLNKHRVDAEGKSTNLDRPQTAPAALCWVNGGRNDPTKGKSAGRPRATFTSSYISRSMRGEMEAAGLPFDLLQTTQAKEQARPKSSQENRRALNSLKDSRKSPISVVEFSFKDMFSEHDQVHRPATVPTAVSGEDLFRLTSGVAAQMTIDKEMRAVQNRFKRKIMTAQPTARISPRQLVTSPVDRPQATKDGQTKLLFQKYLKQSPRALVDRPTTDPNVQIHQELSQVQDKPEAGETFLLQGRAMKFPNHTTRSGFDTIPEEQLSSTSFNQTTPFPPKDVGSSEGDGSQMNKASNEPAQTGVKDSSEQMSSTNSAKAANEQTTHNSPPDSEGKVATDSIAETKSDKPEVLESAPSSVAMPMSATVTVKTEATQSERRADKQKATPQKKKRLTAEVKVTTLTFEFLNDDKIVQSRSQTSKKTMRQLHRTRSPRPLCSQPRI